MNFLKKEPIDDLNDISYVNPEIENKSTLKLTIEILSDSIFNIFPILLLIVIDGINLIFIGHQIDQPGSPIYFNYFEISVAFLNLFGLSFAQGACKTIKKGTNIQKYFGNTKIVIITLVIFLILPVAIVSYYLLSFIYENERAEVLSMLWYIYKNYLVFSPIFILFQLLLQLNLRGLQNLNERSNCFWIVFSHITLHIIFLYIFVHLLKLEILGVLLSEVCSSFISYVFSNSILDEKIYISNNFYFIPNLINFSSNEFCNDFIKQIKNNFLAGFIFYAEYSGFGFFLLFSFFISQTALSVNIILINFFSLLHIIGQGFSYTLRHYIRLSMSSYKHSHIGKKKYVKLLSILAFIMALIFAVVILTLDGSIVNIYFRTNANGDIKSNLPSSTNINKPSHNFTTQDAECYHSLFSQVANFYALIIFFDYISKLLDGYVKGIDAKTTHLLIYKLSFLIIFIPAGLVLCFIFDFGLMGFWISIYVYIVIYAIINVIYVYKYYAMWFH